MKVYVYTLGCRVNQCESEAIAQSFADNGHQVLQSHEEADLVIVNTCTVTSKAEQKARRMIRLFAENSVVIATGCYAQVNAQSIQALSDKVVVVGLDRKATLLKIAPFIKGDVLSDVKAFLDSDDSTGGLFSYAAKGFSYHCRSYLKVQDGCDNNCGFCRVHIARGPSHSLDADVAVQRALELEKAGYHEIVLTGVNLTMYDHEKDGLGGLLEKMLPKLGSEMRLRLSSLEPDHIDDRLLRQLEDPRMQPYFHIPLQSAADKVIQRINRNYDSAHLEYVIGELRKIKDDPFLACDVITGLPAEGDEEFEFTRSFIERHGFALMHVFPFSPRPDTDLYRAKDRCPESVRDERAQVLRDLSEILNRRYVARQIGRENEVILEKRHDGLWYALTGNYIKCMVSGVDPTAKEGDLCKVILTGPDTAKAIDG